MATILPTSGQITKQRNVKAQLVFSFLYSIQSQSIQESSPWDSNTNIWVGHRHTQEIDHLSQQFSTYGLWSLWD